MLAWASGLGHRGCAVPRVCVAIPLAKGLEFQKMVRTKREPHPGTHKASAPSNSSRGNRGKPEELPLTPVFGHDLNSGLHEPIILRLSASHFMRLYLFITEKINYLVFSTNRLKVKTFCIIQNGIRLCSIKKKTTHPFIIKPPRVEL